MAINKVMTTFYQLASSRLYRALAVHLCFVLFDQYYQESYNYFKYMQILKSFFTQEALVSPCIHVVSETLKRKQAESCFLSAFYGLSDLYSGILIKMHK